MASAADRAVSLGIGIKTTGEEAIKALTQEVKELAKSGGAAAPAYEKLAVELGKLGQQAASVEAFKALGASVEALAAEQRQAAETADQLRAKLAAASDSVRSLAASQAQAKTEFAAAQDAIQGNRSALERLNAETAKAERSDASYITQARALKVAIVEGKDALYEKRKALSEANTQLSQAEASEKKLEGQYNRSARAAEAAAEAMQAQERAMREVAAAAEKLGVDVSDVTAAEVRLLDTQQSLVAEANASAQAALKNADYMKFWAQAADQLAQAEKDAAIEADRLGKAQREAAEYAEQLMAAERRVAEGLRATAEAATKANEATLAAAQRADDVKFWAAAIDQLALAEKEAATTAAQLAASTELTAKAQREAAEYAEQLIAAERKVADQMRATAASTTKANEAALASAKNADYVKFWAQAAEQLAQAEKEAADQATYLAGASERASVALKEAFGQAGVRSLQAIKGEVDRVGSSMAYLEQQYKVGAISAQDLARATGSAQVRLAQLRQEAQNMPALPGMFEQLNSSINSLVNRFGSLTAAMATVGFAVTPIIDANVQLESLRRTLGAVTGSAKTAGEQIDFLRSVAQKNGLAVGQLTDSFSIFTASMLKSGASLKDTNQLFAGVAAASNTLGLSTEKTGLILTALGQIANKGKVQLEELQGQIGESLPGALKLASESLGITTAELQGLLKNGKLMADDFLPLFGKQLIKTFGEGQAPVKGLAQSFNDLKTAATITVQGLADTSGYKALSAAIEYTAQNFDKLVTAVGTAAKAFAAYKAIDMAREFLGIKLAAEGLAAAKLKEAAATEATAIAERAATPARVANTQAIAAETAAVVANTAAKTTGGAAQAFFGSTVQGLATAFDKGAAAATGARNAVGGFVAALGGPYGVALAGAIAFSKPLGEGIAWVAAKLTGQADALKKVEEQLRKLSDEEQVAAVKRRLVTEENTRTFAQDMVLFQKREDAANLAIQTAEKHVKAVKEQGEASTTLAALTGDETRALEAAAAAAKANVAASTALIDAGRQRITVLEAELEAFIKAGGGLEKLNGNRLEEVRKMKERIDAAKAGLEVDRASLDMADAQAVKAELAAATHRKTADALTLLRSKIESAKLEVKAMGEALEAGLTTTENYRSAQRRLAAAEGELADGLKKTASTMQAKLELTRAGLSVEGARLNASRASAEATEAEARAYNNSSLALEAQTQKKQIEIDQVRLSQRLKAEEISTYEQLTENMRQQARAKGDVTEATRLEILARVRNAEAMKIENSASESRVTQLMREKEALQRLQAQQTSGVSGINAAKPSESGVNANGDKIGSIIGTYGLSLPFQLNAKQMKGELTLADLDDAKKALQVAKDNASSGSAIGVSLEGRADDQAWIGRLTRIVREIEAMRPPTDPDAGLTPYELKQKKLKEGGGTTSSSEPGFTPAPTPAPTSTPSSTSHTVTLNFGGNSSTVSMASGEDAANLVSLLETISKRTAP